MHSTDSAVGLNQLNIPAQMKESKWTDNSLKSGPGSV